MRILNCTIIGDYQCPKDYIQYIVGEETVFVHPDVKYNLTDDKIKYIKEVIKTGRDAIKRLPNKNKRPSN
jgi:hypothetical protein